MNAREQALMDEVARLNELVRWQGKKIRERDKRVEVLSRSLTNHLSRYIKGYERRVA